MLDESVCVCVIEAEACDENVSQTHGPGMITPGADVGGVIGA